MEAPWFLVIFAPGDEILAPLIRLRGYFAVSASALLVGEGVVLGLNEAWNFEEQVLTGWTPDQLILVGTDGIWEAENPAGEMFGKERLRSILRRCHERPATMILQDIFDALGRFRNGSHQNDDITLVLIKAPGNATNLHMSGA